MQLAALVDMMGDLTMGYWSARNTVNSQKSCCPLINEQLAQHGENIVTNFIFEKFNN
jgi:hypothetical protein